MFRIIATILFMSLLSVSCQGKEPPAGGTDTPVYSKGDQTYTPASVRKVLDRQQKAAFNYFYEGAEPQSGMALEGNNRGNTITIGGSGFGAMAIVVGVERGWISREEGVSRIRKLIKDVDTIVFILL